MFTVRIVRPFDSPGALLPWLADSPIKKATFDDLTDSQRQAFEDDFVERVRSKQGDGPYGPENEGRIAIGVK